MRRHFALPKNDVRFLDGLELEWEAVKDGSYMWVILHDWPIPPGYLQQQASAAIMIPPNYPAAQIDMVYFRPSLTLKNKKPIGATTYSMQIDGNSWQRWSRHRTGENPWRVGIDDISAHMTLVQYWLARETDAFDVTRIRLPGCTTFSEGFAGILTLEWKYKSFIIEPDSGGKLFQRSDFEDAIPPDKRHLTNRISRRHIRIYNQGADWLVTLISTKSNLKVNDVAATPLAIWALKDGDTLAFGPIRARIAISS